MEKGENLKTEIKRHRRSQKERRAEYLRDIERFRKNGYRMSVSGGILQFSKGPNSGF